MTDKKAKILEPTPENIRLCAQVMKRGGVVGMPTETVYGLAGCTMDPEALSKIFLAKERPTFDPLIVHVALETPTLANLMREQVFYPHELSDLAVKRIDLLIRAFWPGPLTIVVPKSDLVPDLATSGMETVAVRMPKHPVALALIREIGLPVCAPSANRFGRISPTSAQDVVDELGDRIEYVLDGGPSEVGLESTIIRVADDGEVFLLRPGAISVEELTAALKAPVQSAPAGYVDASGKTPAAPGLLASHYAPGKPLVLLPSPLSQMMSAPSLGGHRLPKKVGLLAMKGRAEDAALTLSEILECDVVAETLSENGDWAEAGRNFFRKLRALDASDAELLLAEPCSETTGIGFAIADRLKRASAPKE